MCCNFVISTAFDACKYLLADINIHLSNRINYLIRLRLKFSLIFLVPAGAECFCFLFFKFIAFDLRPS